MEIFDFNKFAKGALAESLGLEMQKVLDNICDLNTDATKTRKVTLNITIKPNKNRDLASVSIQPSSRLAPVLAVESSIMLEMNYESGHAVSSEIKSVIDGQVEMQSVNDAEAPIKGDNILDLKSKKAN